MRSTRIAGLVAALLLLAVAAEGCGGSSSDSPGGRLSLVAYSTPQEAYEQVIPAFQETDAGRGVEFKQSFGASGEQARAVIAGLPADVVAVSLAPDVEKLVEAGKVAKGWAAGPTKGMVTNSVVRPRGAQGQPEEHPHLGGRRQAGRAGRDP